MVEKKFVVPEILPILPVRDTVLFPGAVLPLTVGRDRDPTHNAIVAILLHMAEDDFPSRVHEFRMEIEPSGDLLHEVDLKTDSLRLQRGRVRSRGHFCNRGRCCSRGR